MRARKGSSRLRAASLIATFVVLAFPGSALGHAELQRAIPADGDTVTDPITVVTGTYSQGLAPNSKLLVKDASGVTVATGSVDPGNVRRMIARPATPLGNGVYQVQSTSVSADDGDIERVQWTFTVAVAASPSPTEAPSSSAPTSPEASLSVAPSLPASPSASAAPSPSPSPTDSTSDSSQVLLPIIAALAIVGIGAAFLLNRNRGRSA
ncbi:MAG TPA: copper resistance protein CopC [Candidatus Limnocylindrales bacterium]|nr:copper resistance protein CopC [Candidatus Limnocylindrales bacterium]